MFDLWLEQEKAAIQLRFGKIRILCMAVVIFMITSVFTEVIFFLDGDGSVMTLISVIFFVFVIMIALSAGNYKKKFIKPLLDSVDRELTTKEAREEFARQMREEAECISYQPLPGLKDCELLAAKEYCYMRQSRKSRILQNRRLRRIVFSQEEYTVGRGHMRWCHALALYASEDDHPVWKGYFMRQEEAARAFALLKALLPPEATVQDEISTPPEGSQKPLWKELLEMLPTFVALAVLVFLIKYFLM